MQLANFHPYLLRGSEVKSLGSGIRVPGPLSQLYSLLVYDIGQVV